MNDILIMNVLNRLDNLEDDVGRPGFIVALVRLNGHLAVDAFVRAVLHDEVDVLLIMEEAIQGQNVLMLHVTADFDLALKLLLHVVLDELLFVQDFETNNKL